MKRKFLLLFLFVTSAIFSATLITSCSAEDDNEVKEIIFSNVNNGKVTLDEGEEFIINYIITPTELQDVAEIAWETTNKSVARVRNGKITAVGEGTATISAYSGNASASVKVTVNPVAVTYFNLPGTINAYKNQRVKVDVTDIQPENGSIASIEWRISDEDIATLEIDGGELYITALKDGSTTLTGITENCKKSCNIAVKEYIPVSSINVSLSKSSISVGETTTISATVLPNNASIKDITWSFLPSSLVEFNEQTLSVTGTRSGTVTVRATSVDGVIGEKTLTINPPILQLSLEKDDAENTSSNYNILCPDQSVGKFKSSLQLILSCNDTEIDIEDAVWKSSNESVATVSSNGLVTAKGHGFTDISATINNTSVNIRVRSVKSSGFKFSVANPNDFKVPTTSIATPRKKVNTRYIDEVFKNDTEIYNMSDFWEKVGQSFSASSSNSNLISVVNTGEVDVLYLKADAPGSSTINISPKYGSSINVAVKMSFESMTFIGANTGKVYGTVQNNGTINIIQTNTSETIYAYCNAGSSYDSSSSCLIYRDLDYDITWNSDNKSRKHPFYNDYLFYTGTYNNLTSTNFGTYKCNLSLTKN